MHDLNVGRRTGSVIEWNSWGQPVDGCCEQPPVRMVAGALAHLAQHMETGCPRAAQLAVLLLARIAGDADADEHLRRHAHELMEILERGGHGHPGVASPVVSGRQSQAALSTV